MNNINLYILYSLVYSFTLHALKIVSCQLSVVLQSVAEREWGEKKRKREGERKRHYIALRLCEKGVPRRIWYIGSIYQCDSASLSFARISSSSSFSSRSGRSRDATCLSCRVSHQCASSLTIVRHNRSSTTTTTIITTSSGSPRCTRSSAVDVHTSRRRRIISSSS